MRLALGEQNMKSKMVSILISLIMITNIFGAIIQNVGEPSISSNGTEGLPPSNISKPIPQIVGQPCSNSCGAMNLTISNIPPPIPKNVGQPSSSQWGSMDFTISNIPAPNPQIVSQSSSSLSVSGGLADSPWPMFRQNLNHTGQSPYDTSGNPGKLKWSFSADWTVHSSPTIGSDATIYIGSYDGKLYAINPCGTEKWNFTAESGIGGSPAIGFDGTIYIGSWDQKFYAINPDGTEKWNFTTGSAIDSSAAIGPDGTIYVGSHGNNLYAINPDGSEKWHFSTGSSMRSSPAIDLDGTIYVGSLDYNLYAIKPDGTEKWNFTADWYIEESSPALGLDGTIYVGSRDNKLYAINPDGSKKWSFSTDDEVESSPAIGLDGTIYIGSFDKKLYAINPDGSEKWNFTTGDHVHSSPAIGSDGTIYVGSRDYNLYAINPDGSEKWNFTADKYVISSPAIGPDGTIYVGSHDYKLYAIGSFPPNITVEKTANVTHTKPGDTINYTIYYNNTITSDSTDELVHQQLTFENSAQSFPSYSPDGSKIVFSSFEDSGSYMDIWVMDADGSNHQQLTFEHASQEDPSFSPDGSKIVYYSYEDLDGDEDIWTMNSDGSNHQQLTDVSCQRYPSFSPDGSKIVYMSQEDGGFDYDIWIMNSDGSNHQQLTFEDVEQFYPSFSPDSSKIVYSSKEDGGAGLDIWIINTDGSNHQQLTFENDNHYHPSFSPDGSKIVYSSLEDGGMYEDIWIMNADGSDHQQLTNEYVCQLWPTFSPDGEKITYQSKEDGGSYYDIWILTRSLGTIAKTVWINDTLLSEVTFVTSSGELNRTGNYNWTFYDVEPGEHNFTITVQVNAGVPNGTILTNYVHLDLTDHRGNPMPGSFDSVDVIVIAEEYTPPVADAGPDQTVNEGDIVQFEALASTDPDGTIESYEWDFDANDGLWWETGVVPDATGPTATHTYGDDGIYIVTLRVIDNDNLSATDTCNITVQNVNPTVVIESIAMDVEIGLRVAGRKYNDVGMTLYEDGNLIGNVSIERMPGSPNEQMAWIPVSINFSRSYSAIVTYTPEDPPNVGGNPVWIYIKSKDGTTKKIHHTFNVQQSKKRDSDHWNHIEPWEVDLNPHFIGLPFEITSHVTDPGSDDETLTYTYGSQTLTVTHLNDPPNLDPYPSPEVNPVDIIDTTTLIYEGTGTVTVMVEDDDGELGITTLDI